MSSRMMMVSTITASPKLPIKYLDIRTNKFSIGSRRIVFHSPVMVTTPLMRRKISTTTSRIITNLAILKVLAGLASLIASSISLT